MKKRFCCLAAVFLLTMMPMTAHAEHYYGAEDWNVYFNGNEMVENFTDAQMSEAMSEMQPGDDVLLQVHLKNAYKEATDWYMTNEVISTLEESVNVAEGGAYSYLLKYYDNEGKERVLYDSEVVGGEEDTSLEGLGLHQATNALEDYYYLDRIGSQEEGLVTLYVKLEGETQGNDYQDTLAQLKMNFAVELVQTGAPQNGGSHKTVTKQIFLTRVQTGDQSKVVLFSALTLVSGIILLTAAVVVLKKRKAKKGDA